MINLSYGKQNIDKKDIDAVTKVLKSNYLTQGPTVKKFERNLAKYTGSKYCSAVNNGTSALFLSGKALDWKKGDIIITSPLTFLATANAVIYNNATPDFVDINERDYNIDLNILENKIKLYRKKNKKIRAVIGVDFAGQPCDWHNLRYLANKYNFYLINDNCHALGAGINKNKKYAIKYADIITQSFHPVKNITTGEGGAIITNSKKINNKINELRSHGMIKDKKRLLNKDGPWYYEMQNLGYNCRVTDFQCALGITQLSKLDFFIKKRNKIANFYNKNLKNLEFISTPFVHEKNNHAYHLYVPQFDFKKTKINKIDFYNSLQRNGINLMVHYLPLILQPYYKKKYGFKVSDYTKSIDYYKKAFSLPIFPSIKDKELEHVYKVIKKYFK